MDETGRDLFNTIQCGWFVHELALARTFPFAIVLSFQCVYRSPFNSKLITIFLHIIFRDVLVSEELCLVHVPNEINEPGNNHLIGKCASRARVR